LNTLFDIFGYAGVVLQGFDLVARTLLIGSVAFALWIAAPLGREPVSPEVCGIAADTRRVLAFAALAALITAVASTALNAAVLSASIGASLAHVAGATFVAAGAVKALAAAAIGASVLAGGTTRAWTRNTMGVAAFALLCASVATSHAVARLDHSGVLATATAMHELGAALWLGGLLCFRLALLRARTPRIASRIGTRYSAQAIAGVALIVCGATVFAICYIGSPAAVYGTAYGAMAATKTILLCLLLAVGLVNFRTVRRFAERVAGPQRVGRLVEVEMGIGIAALMTAASITSLPPSADLVEDRLTWPEIAARMAPAPPRLASPAHDTLAIPALQALLAAEAAKAEPSSRPQAFVPGESEIPPRNASDIAWSEYNHHWAGLLVAAMGLAALARKSGRAPWARHWPLLFLALAAFLFVRADPEVWPLGDIGFLASLRDPEVVQHRIFVAIIAGFAWFEWGVSTGQVVSRPLKRVFPLLIALAATLLLTHSHALGNVKEELLIELTHLPIAVLGLVAGWARWLEVEAPTEEGRWSGWVWPTCLVFVGLLLIGYREA
jgi:putative copper resistance protein D